MVIRLKIKKPIINENGKKKYALHEKKEFLLSVLKAILIHTLPSMPI